MHCFLCGFHDTVLQVLELLRFSTIGISTVNINCILAVTMVE